MINGKHNKVSLNVREKVMKAIDKFDYYPDYNAVGLSKKNSNLICIIYNPNSFSINTYEDFKLFSEIESNIQKNSYNAIVTSAQNKALLSVIKKRHIEGLIILDIDIYKTQTKVLKKIDKPIYIINSYNPDFLKNSSSVSFDLNSKYNVIAAYFKKEKARNILCFSSNVNCSFFEENSLILNFMQLGFDKENLHYICDSDIDMIVNYIIQNSIDGIYIENLDIIYNLFFNEKIIAYTKVNRLNILTSVNIPSIPNPNIKISSFNFDYAKLAKILTDNLISDIKNKSIEKKNIHIPFTI